ncbi:hypothetical protein [Sphingomonas adhaesiva]|uniref:hypothetical protein n=1 Tax=Sphingomonas adhaesiva TaxID=28212 RepID=UPI002FF9F304
MMRPPAPPPPEQMEPATSLVLSCATILSAIAVTAALLDQTLLAWIAGLAAGAGAFTVLRHLVNRESR